MNGKGSAPRPVTVDRDTYARNWYRAFGRARRRPTSARPGLVAVERDGRIVYQPEKGGHHG